jgi:hypothetical protein
VAAASETASAYDLVLLSIRKGGVLDKATRGTRRKRTFFKMDCENRMLIFAIHSYGDDGEKDKCGSDSGKDVDNNAGR